jgi:hypothetical protein
LSLGRSKIVREIRSWSPFGDALRVDDRELYRKMVQDCCEYLPSMEARAEPFPSEALFMGLIFLQHRIIDQLTRQLEDLERKGR